MTERSLYKRQMNRVTKELIIFISQGAYAGRFPVVPGTAGTVAGVLLYLAMKGLSPAWYLFWCAVIIAGGTWAAGRAEVLLERKDPPSVVIDEVAGFLLSMFMVPPQWGFVVAGFFLFRIFDIIKPYPLNRLQDLHGGAGVMLDDIGAGIYTNIVLQLAAYLKLL
ncbi:MAG: phosphatidylglycerophosphatase A [Nitrospirota bacterium]